MGKFEEKEAVNQMSLFDIDWKENGCEKAFGHRRDGVC